MRILAAIVLLALCIPSIQAVAPTVRISELLSDPGGEREFVELWNPTDQDVDLTGWVLEDAAATRFTFPSWRLPPGGRVVVWGGGESDGLGPAWSRSSVWNNGGDEARLLDAAGQEVDRFAYGDHPNATVAAPPTGQSLQWDAAWTTADPTPGRGPGSDGGSASFGVQDLPPTVAFLDPPYLVRPGENVTVRFRVDEPNGDPVTWSFAVAGTVVTTGDATGEGAWTARSPDTTGAWLWSLEAADGSSSNRTQWTVQVQTSPLRVVLPPGGVQFPALVPGARDVAALAPFTVRNEGDTAVTPRLDLSPFRGQDATVAVDGNVHLRIDGADFAYGGPLTPLPDLAPGAAYDVLLVLDALPVPLAAGPYGTTFTVVA